MSLQLSNFRIHVQIYEKSVDKPLWWFPHNSFFRYLRLKTHKMFGKIHSLPQLKTTRHLSTIREVTKEEFADLNSSFQDCLEYRGVEVRRRRTATRRVRSCEEIKVTSSSPSFAFPPIVNTAEKVCKGNCLSNTKDNALKSADSVSIKAQRNIFPDFQPQNEKDQASHEEKERARHSCTGEQTKSRVLTSWLQFFG